MKEFRKLIAWLFLVLSFIIVFISEVLISLRVWKMSLSFFDKWWHMKENS